MLCPSSYPPAQAGLSHPQGWERFLLCVPQGTGGCWRASRCMRACALNARSAQSLDDIYGPY